MGNHEQEHSVFHLDCSELIPECGYRCGECINELRVRLHKMPGVRQFSTEGEGEKMLFVVEHDAATVSVEQLMGMFASLPTRHEGSFRPSLLHRGMS